MTTYWPVAFITFKEGIRNRAIYGIIIMALMLLIVNSLLCSMIPQEVGKVAVDIALSTVYFSGLLLVFFVGINLMAKDLDKRTIYMVISRPISRSQYIFGKFLGMVLLIIAAMVILGIFAVVSIFLIKWSYPGYFLRFSWPMVLLALAFSVLPLILLSAMSFLFASFTSSSFTTLVLTMIAYIIGRSSYDVKALVESVQASSIQPSPVTVNLVKIAYYLFPNLSVFDIKTQAAHGIPVAGSYIVWVVLYAFVYTSLALAIAALIFRRREFP
jgi:ABC-type transport system involved in multi-copper enzyme maturation permease subunit